METYLPSIGITLSLSPITRRWIVQDHLRLPNGDGGLAVLRTSNVSAEAGLVNERGCERYQIFRNYITSYTHFTLWLISISLTYGSHYFLFSVLFLVFLILIHLLMFFSLICINPIFVSDILLIYSPLKQFPIPNKKIRLFIPTVSFILTASFYWKKKRGLGGLLSSCSY